jgi:hypothetical protein
MRIKTWHKAAIGAVLVAGTAGAALAHPSRRRGKQDRTCSLG